MKHVTQDREASVSTKFYTVEKLGQKQSLTPEGFLLCEDVPVARTGTMIYGLKEVPIRAGRDGLVKISRDADEVFNPEYLASFVGKPVVDEHPQYDVNPDNWSELAIGTVQNPRRGTGMQSDLLIVDFLITTPEGIEAVRSGKREVSVGYMAEYEETGPGEGRQYNMIANHVALVEAGRCGSRCAIGDSKVNLTGDSEMKTKDGKKWFDRAMDSIRKAVASKDAEQIEKAMEEAEKAKDEAESSSEPTGTHVHVHSSEGGEGMAKDEDLQAHISQNEKEHQEFRDAIAALTEKVNALSPAADTKDNTEAEKAMEKETGDDLMEEAPAGTADKARMAKDSAYLGDSYQETIAQAEILVPGIRIPTYDKAADPKTTLDSICKLRRMALDLAYAQPEGRGFINEVHGKSLELEGMKCNAVRSLFRSVVALKKAANNKGSQTGDLAIRNTGAGMGTRVSIADINNRNKKYYDAQNI